jgi:hypothetical protein
MSGEAQASSPEKENHAFELRAVKAEAKAEIAIAKAEAKAEIAEAKAKAKVEVAEAKAETATAKAAALLLQSKLEHQADNANAAHKVRSFIYTGRAPVGAQRASFSWSCCIEITPRRTWSC